MQGGICSTIVRIPHDNAHYPPLLRQIPTAPKELFVRGNVELLTRPSVAVIGSRRMSPYGARIIAEFVPPLAARLVIVSGMALGTDGAAHCAALSCGGATIAVLGSGVDDDSIYPAAHKKLAHRILENGGAIISEYPLGTAARDYQFPLRNRIIAGMTRGTLISEAAAESGTLITANCAMEFNRDLCAVPGSIYSPQCAGTNELLKATAHLVCTPDDVLALLGVCDTEPSRQRIMVAADERAVLDALGDTPRSMDELTRVLNWSLGQIASVLVRLEMMALVRALPGIGYVAMK